MATATTVPTIFHPWARTEARGLGVERELDAILERGRQTLQGLRRLEVDLDTESDMGPAVVIRAWVDPASENDPSHAAWWNWRIDEYGPEVATNFVVVVLPDRGSDAR